MTTRPSLAGRRVWLCDLDGTLVDSAPAHEAAFRDAIAELTPGLLESFRYAEHAGGRRSSATASPASSSAIPTGPPPATSAPPTRRTSPAR